MMTFRSVRLMLPLFAAMAIASCGGGKPVELMGSWDHPETGVRIYWFAADEGLTGEQLKEAAEQQIASVQDLPKTAELYFFRDRLLAKEWASEDMRIQVSQGAFFEPASALAGKGGGILHRTEGADPVWEYYPPAERTAQPR